MLEYTKTKAFMYQGVDLFECSLVEELDDLFLTVFCVRKISSSIIFKPIIQLP